MPPLRSFATLLLALFSFLAQVGCDTATTNSTDDPFESAEQSHNPLVIDIPEGDEAMAAAVEKARATIDEFIAALKEPTETQDSFAVKLEVTDGDTSEFMWLTSVTYRDGTFTGTLNNEPRDLTTVSLGDELSVSKADIADWMYLDDGRIAGGYSIRVVMQAAPPEQREAMQATMKFMDE